jgi:hypothetical protein
MKLIVRLHPATGLTLARVVPKGGAFLAGRKFDEGVIQALFLLILDCRWYKQLGSPSQRRCLWCGSR